WAEVISYNSGTNTGTVRVRLKNENDPVGALVAISNEIKADYNAHLSAADVHTVDDVSNVVATADATDTASAITLLNAIKAARTAHIADTDSHAVADSTNT